MTTIAWDGKTLAVDTQSTADSIRRTVAKARPSKSGKEILAWAGCGAYGRVLCEWYEAGADPEAWPKFQHEGDDQAVLIVATARRVEVYSGGVAGHPDITLVEENPFYAWGSGYKIALGAMAAGKSAHDAVLIASRYDVFTNAQVMWFPLCPQ